MAINQRLREIREGLEPKRKFPCACEFKCEHFGLDMSCDCTYCGTKNVDEYRSAEDLAHMKP